MRDIDASLTKASEGLRLSAYLCPAGKLTIGYGHTGPDVAAGMTITPERADELLAQDLAKAGAFVEKMVKVDLALWQFSALADFAFNLGGGALAGSTLLAKLNAGDLTGAAAEFSKWDKAHVNGVVQTLPGLTLRRKREAALFLGGAWA